MFLIVTFSRRGDNDDEGNEDDEEDDDDDDEDNINNRETVSSSCIGGVLNPHLCYHYPLFVHSTYASFYF